MEKKATAKVGQETDNFFLAVDSRGETLLLSFPRHAFAFIKLKSL
jgi:hypothetical protein